MGYEETLPTMCRWHPTLRRMVSNNWCISPIKIGTPPNITLMDQPFQLLILFILLTSISCWDMRARLSLIPVLTIVTKVTQKRKNYLLLPLLLVFWYRLDRELISLDDILFGLKTSVCFNELPLTRLQIEGRSDSLWRGLSAAAKNPSFIMALWLLLVVSFLIWDISTSSKFWELLTLRPFTFHSSWIIPRSESWAWVFFRDFLLLLFFRLLFKILSKITWDLVLNVILYRLTKI